MYVCMHINVYTHIYGGGVYVYTHMKKDLLPFYEFRNGVLADSLYLRFMSRSFNSLSCDDAPDAKHGMRKLAAVSITALVHLPLHFIFSFIFPSNLS